MLEARKITKKMASSASSELACFRCGKTGHLSKDCRPNLNPSEKAQRETNKNGTGYRNDLKCYWCGKIGHIALKCPNQALYCDNSANVPHLLAAVFDEEHDLATEFSTRRGNDEHTRSGFVNGLPADDIILDTGCSQTLVHSRFVSDAELLEDQIELRCAHGDSIAYPIAKVSESKIIMYVRACHRRCREMFYWEKMSQTSLTY